uniref:Uncharacterized protein n=1 Tax=Arundo donax TaxID=35708 RepID=A0A0A9HGY7_ARUDO
MITSPNQLRITSLIFSVWYSFTGFCQRIRIWSPTKQTLIRSAVI